MKKLFLLTGIIIFLNSCGSSKKTVPHKTKEKTIKITKKDPKVIKIPNDKNSNFVTLRYINKYSDIAKKEMKDFGVPASITMAQGILESQSGKSRLAVKANNHFGIKCHKQWHGKTILHDDNRAQECFRKYHNPEASFKDHSKFLANRKRYAFLFKLAKTDYKAWARGLKKAGYATDPGYPDKLIYIIEKYNLAKLDKDVLTQKSVQRNDVNKTTPHQKRKLYYKVKEGESLMSIAHKFHIPVQDLQRINNLNDFNITPGQFLVLPQNFTSENTVVKNIEKNNNSYIEETKIEVSKTNKIPEQINAIPEIVKPRVKKEDVKLHIVEPGETLYFISKSYHVDIDELRQINHLIDNQIKAGSVIKIPKQKNKMMTHNESENVEVVPENEKTTPIQEEAVFHVVQPGETLYRIHINYQVSINQLKTLNHLKGNSIKVGQKLRIK